MFDDLREQAGDEEFDDETMGFEDVEEEQDGSIESRIRQRARGLDLSFGMTPGQRATLAVFLMVTVCILSGLCLLVTGKIGF